MVLKDPCYELSEAKPKDIPGMLPKILNMIRMIWVNSEFYKTRERLTGILKKVKNSLILMKFFSRKLHFKGEIYSMFWNVG